MNKAGYHFMYLFVCLWACLLAGCAGTPAPSGEDVSQAHTQAVQTVSAQLTLDAGNTAVAMLTQLAQATTAAPAVPTTATPVPSTPTPVPATPTDTPLPPTATEPPLPCDWLRFVSDVSVPDGQEFLPGVKFTKTWRLENVGSCTWTRQYALVFVAGDRMDGAMVVPLERDVPPGATVDLSVGLTAPASADTYTGYWQLRNAGGVLFGAGTGQNQAFFVRIQVAPEEEVVYDLAANYCKAGWVNSRGSLECPTPSLDVSLGYVYSSSAPLLENRAVEDEPTLIVHPDQGGSQRFDLFGEQGLIAGEFPVLLIKDGYRFETVIGCLFDSQECNVLFYLLVQKPNGNYEIEASWQEFYDGEITPVSVDLSEWAGKELRLLLVVVANGDAQGDHVFWLHPRVLR